MESMIERAHGHALWYVAGAIAGAIALQAVGVLIYSLLLPLTG